jgi:hypothetical protein
MVFNCVQMSLPQPILSQMNPAHTHPLTNYYYYYYYYFFKNHFTYNLPEDEQLLSLMI